MYRVIWKYKSARVGDLNSEKLTEARELFAAHRTAFDKIALWSAPEAVFSQPKATLRRTMLDAFKALAEDAVLDMAAYHHAFVAGRDDAEQLRDRLLNTADIESAEIQARPRCARWVSDEARLHRPELQRARLEDQATPDFTSLQGYLRPAPEGIDAEHAWTVAGGRGDAIRIVDIEWGWNFQHEDLREIQGGVVHGIPRDDDHGTAVLGIYSADRNAHGIEGIASHATAFAAAATYGTAQDPNSGRTLGKWNAAGAIAAAMQRLRPGDVILLEMHGPGPNTPTPENDSEGFVPVEYWDAEYAAIRLATARGIHVVQAAGNGSEDLDDAVYSGRFDRARRDSGAIMVGGGAPPDTTHPRSRMWWSNYGSRLDVQGWGDSIVTTGGHEPYYHDLHYHQDPSRCYLQTFGGTSGAAPIVVGAVACISGALEAAGHEQLSAQEMRDLLIDTGTPQEGAERIGPMPDLRQALDELGLS